MGGSVMVICEDIVITVMKRLWGMRWSRVRERWPMSDEGPVSCVRGLGNS